MSPNKYSIKQCSNWRYKVMNGNKVVKKNLLWGEALALFRKLEDEKR